MQSHAIKGTRRIPPRTPRRAMLLLVRARVGAVWLRVVMPGLIVMSCDHGALPDGLPNTQDCSSCHGSRDNAAPPKAVSGSTNTSDVGVGAHQTHLVAGHVAAPIPCTECHRLPLDLLSHPAALPRAAVVVFGETARLYGLVPVWNREAAACSDTYCHGTRLSGAADRPSPIWTVVDGRQRSCGSCHGNPPGGDHPASAACHQCHGDVVNPDGTIKDLTRHVDGNVDFQVEPDAGGAAGGTVANDANAIGAGGTP